MCALVASSCTVGRDALNARLPVLEEGVERRLANDDLAGAEIIARDLEQRIPGVDTYALLGRVLWRTGALMDAEGFSRRSAVTGVPEGQLGLARAALARRDLDGLHASIAPLLEVEATRARAHRLRAALALAAGDRAAAASYLEGAAAATANPRAELDGAEASALAELAGIAYPDWQGRATAGVDVAPDGTFEVMLDGRPARALLTLLPHRSTIARGRRIQDAPVARARVGIGALEVDAVLRLASLPEGIDLTVGFDLLHPLHWSLDAGAGRLELATGARMLEPLALPRTYWTNVRLPRDGLGVQLLVLPRMRAEPTVAGLDPYGPTRIDYRLLGTDEPLPGGNPVEIELRLGAWRQQVNARLDDLYPLGADGAVAARAVIGAGVLRDWRLVWSPPAAQLALERRPVTDG